MRPHLLTAVVAALVVYGASSIHAENYAVIVGVNECPGFLLADGSRPRPLRGAEGDADTIRDLLTSEYGFTPGRTLLLKGRDATRARIKASFEQIAKRTGPGDRFVFYFAGHGTQIEDRPPYDEPDGLDEALCPYDTDGRGVNLIVDDELGLWLDAIPAGSVTVILDCCHAGTGAKEADPDVRPRFLPMPVTRRPTAPTKLPWRELGRSTKDLSSRRLTAFYACRPDEQAYERRFPGQPAGVRSGQFSRALAEGLRGKAANRDGDGVVTNRELLDDLTRRLEESFNRTRPAAAEQQHPTVETDDPAGMVFGLRPTRRP